MRKDLYYLLFILVLLVSCEEVYHPNMDTVEGRLVVEAQITNDLKKNIIHLSRTRSFYDRLSVIEVSGASVTLVDLVSKSSVKAFEASSGHYTLNFVPETGKQYFLRIIIQNVVYESASVTMPPLPAFTRFYNEEVTKTFWSNNGDGIPRPVEKLGRELYFDLPVTASLSHYRFEKREIVQWSWDSPYKGDIKPTAFGWYSFRNKESFHLAAPKDFSETEKIEKYPLDMITYSPIPYIYSDTLQYHGMILIFEQFGTSKESYDYHLKLNNQFAATGSLFDPVQTQVFGNIICKTFPSEIVYGFFDLNSYRQYRYYYFLNTPPGVTILRPVYRFPDIPDEGQIRAAGIVAGLPPPEPIMHPVWWEEE